MEVFWIVVSAVVMLLGLLLFALVASAKQEDRTSRHIQHTMNPFDDITITKPGE